MIILRFFMGILSLLFYPFVYLFQILTSGKGFLRITAGIVFSLMILLPMWVAAYISIVLGAWLGLQYVGVTRVPVPVSGSSMLPTFDETGYVQFYRYKVPERFQPELQRKDVVVFRNQETDAEFRAREEERGSGFVKRILGLPGDIVVVRDGFVYVNGQLQEEPYILDPRSTFGREAVRDCQPVTVPEGKLYVMGDNRKVSMDSRQIGLIEEDTIEYYLPFQEQEESLSTRWRDASDDESHAFASEFDAEAYVDLLNTKRLEAGLEELNYEPLLSDSAQKRAEVMLQYDDLSFEATRSGYTMKNAMDEVGYFNPVYGEVPTVGYYNEEELFDSFFEYETSKEFFLEPRYQDIGISTFVGSLNGCPVQVVVQHLAGFVPPNYDASVVESWRTALSRLRDIQGGWEELRENESFYQENRADIDRLNEVIALRISRIEQIVAAMDANRWLTAEQERYMDEDDGLSAEQDQLAEKLNRAISQ